MTCADAYADGVLAAVTINELESRLVDDIRMYMTRLAPPNDHYLHNDIHLRPQTEEDRRRVVANGWDVSDGRVLEEWRAQEPFNAHSHMLAMLWGASECIPVLPLAPPLSPSAAGGCC